MITDPATGDRQLRGRLQSAPRVDRARAQTSETTHLFAGAKTVQMLDAYGPASGVPRFDDAVDWG